MGDNARLPTVRGHVLVLAVVVAMCLVLVIVGDSSLRPLGLMGLIFGLGVLIPSAIGCRNTFWRVRNGRGLVIGDPYRAREGVDPAEAQPGNDAEA